MTDLEKFLHNENLAIPQLIKIGTERFIFIALYRLTDFLLEKFLYFIFPSNKMNKRYLATVITFLVFNYNTAKATDYSQSDLSSPITNSSSYDNVTITNSRTLSSGSLTGGYVYFSNNITGDVNITNEGSITSTHSNYGIFYFPNIGNISTISTVNVTNSGSLTTTGTFSIPIYILRATDGVFPSFTQRSFDGQLNNSGTITSSAGAVGYHNGSLGSFEITNSGTIDNSSNTGASSTINLSGNNSTVTNSGTITAHDSSYTAIQSSGNNFTVNILSGSNITGKIKSGDSTTNNNLNIKKSVSLTEYNNLADQLVAGTGAEAWRINVAAAGGLTIANGETLSSATLSGSGTISNSGTVSALTVSGSGNTLNLATGNSTGNIANSGALTISPGSSNITYSNAISGTGSITKTGSGRLELTGVNTYSGTTTVSAGELKVNGSASSSAVTVSSGATISGTGTVGALTINSGATLAAGNSPGTLNVSGDLTLNSGSTTNFEFTSSQVDKIIATGNISIAGSANFQLYGADGYFTITQNILETTGGTISGTFDSTNTDNGFATSLTYSSTAVNATISKTLNSNALDGALSSQNSVSRILSKSLTDQLRNSKYSDHKKTTAWISSGGFNAYRSAIPGSAAYSTTGSVSSAGLINNYGDFQLIGGIFNSNARVNRYIYSGNDDIITNGGALGIGKNFPTKIGDFYLFSQVGGGFYNFNNNRYVNVNGAIQAAKGFGTGNFSYVNFGTSYKVPTNLNGEVGIFTSATLQKTQHGSWHESGLSAGNLDVSGSSANSVNFEIGTSYQDKLPKLPRGSFYKIELTGYKSNLYSQHSATVSQGSTSYNLYSRYAQNFLFGASGYFSIPLKEDVSVNLQIDKRQNGIARELVGTLGLQYGF